MGEEGQIVGFQPCAGCSTYHAEMHMVNFPTGEYKCLPCVTAEEERESYQYGE